MRLALVIAALVGGRGRAPIASRVVRISLTSERLREVGDERSLSARRGGGELV